MSGVSLGTEGSKRLLARAGSDPEFRTKLIHNPHAAIRSELGVELPADYKVTVLEEQERHGYLIIPALEADAELSVAELDLVAGGRMSSGDCTCCFGSTSTRTTSAATCGEKC